jgi:hypothetical protein
MQKLSYAGYPDRERNAEAALVIYADPRLQTPDIIAEVKTALGLIGAEAAVKSALHCR